MNGRNEDVVGGLVESQRLIEFLVGELRELSVRQATNTQQLEGLQEDVAALLKLVRDGNGFRPLTYRVEKLENHWDLHRETTVEDKRGRWAIVAAIISGLCGVLVGIIALFVG